MDGTRITIRRRWIGIAVAVAAVLEFLVVRDAAALGFSRILPAEVRHSLIPGDARTNAEYADQLAAMNDPRQGATVAALSRQALRRDPTVAAAVRNAGLATAIQGDEAATRRQMNYALWLTRRDLGTMLWHIEMRVAAGDVTGSLRNYDIALRASRNAGTVLFPILVSAGGDAELGPKVVAYIARNRPPWTATFLDAVLASSRDWNTVAAVFGGAMRAGVPIAPDVYDQAIRTVAEAGHATEAMAMYAARDPRRAAATIRNPTFDVNRNRSPFDWEFVQNGGRTSDAVGGMLVADVARHDAGLLARQQLMLPAGMYRLTGSVAVEAEQVGRLPYWTIACPGEPATVLEPIRSDPTVFRWQAAFTIRANCTTQWLSLFAQDNQDPTSYRVDEVAVVPS